MNTIKAKKINIIEYLSTFGHHPVQIKRNLHYYLSPLHKEYDPSFCVNLEKNIWFDLVTGEGGTIIDLIIAMRQACSISEALEFLKKLNLEPDNDIKQVGELIKYISPSGIHINEILPLCDSSLVNYLHERKINLEIAKKYCCEIHYQVGFQQLKATGFANESPDGFALRSPNFAGCTKQNISVITRTDQKNRNCLVFDEFLDFLSYLTMKKQDAFESTSVILNSISNLEKAISFLLQHQLKPSLLLGNNKSGRTATNRITDAVPGSVDFSETYGDYEDLNDYLIKKNTFNKDLER